MGRRKVDPKLPDLINKKARDPKDRENQLIALAVDRAEQQIREGTASSQIIVHYLKLASTREKLEQEKIRRENEMLQAKTKAYANAEDIKHLMEDALDAMRTYSGDKSHDIDE